MRCAAFVLAGVIASSTAFAQQPGFVNARVVARAAQPDVPRAIAAIVKAQVEPAWIGYAVPVVNTEMTGRNDGWSERCRLEQQRVDPATNTFVQGPVRLEPAPTVMVLVRVQAGEVRRVRSFSGDCQVDAGGLQLYWMGDVNAAQSVDFLKTLVTNPVPNNAARDQSEGALSAMALHRDAAAAAAILDLAKNGAPRIRQRALFWIARRWLGESKDPRALRFFEEVLR